MVHTGQTAHWIRHLNEDFILILPSSSPITNKPGCSHMLSYSLMHVTSGVCGILNAHVCVCVCCTDNRQTMLIRCFVGVQSCEGAVFTLSELRSTFALLLHNKLLYFRRNTFAMCNTLLYLCTTTDSDRVFPECLPLPIVLNKHRPKFWFQ